MRLKVNVIVYNIPRSLSPSCLESKIPVCMIKFASSNLAVRSLFALSVYAPCTEQGMVFRVLKLPDTLGSVSGASNVARSG